MSLSFLHTQQHHALLSIHSDRKQYADSLWQEMKQNSPANVFFNQTVLDIDTVRSIVAWNHRPYDGKRVALISFHTITVPAQNALLKILEEPQKNTYFILLTSNKGTLLPTLLSRVSEIQEKTTVTSIDVLKDVRQFITANPLVRMKLACITALLQAVDEENRKEREAPRLFLFTLLEEIKRKNISPRYAEEVLAMALYITEPSSSIKAIFEYVSLLLPELQD
ncbi:MAG: hypothetical protein RLZZ308_227 [Candidatus Parcubacteria bacterium]|jgi:hypothetical protein